MDPLYCTWQYGTTYQRGSGVGALSYQYEQGGWPDFEVTENCSSPS